MAKALTSNRPVNGLWLRIDGTQRPPTFRGCLAASEQPDSLFTSGLIPLRGEQAFNQAGHDRPEISASLFSIRDMHYHAP